MYAKMATPEAYEIYLRSDGPNISDGPMTFEQWVNTHRELDVLGAQYDKQIEPYIKPGEMMPYKIRELQEQLLRKMDHLEACLGF